ncbi:potassium uptake TrkH family protein [Barrientosiimonas humi]|uniref:Potassium uptake TrkH family protein n=1 Tax=Barrientosiimonas humi TaxID=999931 RepID=A0A542XEB6_9MICO|nr:potassium transporter TrkG [Barrientosiimonas humi]TQL34171.1 potassium uptake TrkH family protein [Barrientosiimonas humi]CAG7574163.1 Ktr system potassium uptake protein B [Barrientosiimonas humi]
MSEGKSRSLLTTPARMVVTAYLSAIAVGTTLLLMPFATVGPGNAPVVTALFTAVSGVCITGLTTVDTGTYWTPFGQGVILLLVQLGGLGIVTLGTLTALFVRGRLGIRDRMAAQRDAHTLSVGDVRLLLARIVRLFLLLELVVVTCLVLRFRFGYDMVWPTALWQGIFHGVSGANSAGFSLWPDSVSRYVGDIMIIGPLCFGIFVGGLGYPVLFELRNKWRKPDSWSVHTRLTVYGSLALFSIGFVSFAAFEWANPGTLGPLSVYDKGVGALAGAVFPRTAGFNSVDYTLISDESMVTHLVLMFIGGGSAGTAGGIKITTFLILLFVMVAEIRGEKDVIFAHRRIPEDVQRQALTIALGGVACVVAGTIALTLFTDQPLNRVVFEAMSAFCTVGLSANVTTGLNAPAQVVLMVLMFIGRVGTITVVTSLALNRRHRRYRLADERPIVG